MDDEDTIELDLTPEQLAALMHAANPEPQAIPPNELIPPPSPTPRRPFEVKLRTIRIPAIVTVAVFAISLSGAKYAAMSREQDVPLAPTPHSAAPVSAAPTPAAPLPMATSPEPVHFINPFDNSEVFDLPPGTSEDEARAAVAQLLIERAHNRSHMTHVQ